GDLIEAGAAKAVRIVVVAADTEFAAVIVAGIAPLIVAGAPRIEAVVIGPVGIAAVLAIHASGQPCTYCAADNHTCDGSTCAIAATAGAIAQQTADQSADKNSSGIGRAAALLVIDIVVVAVIARIAPTPAVVAVGTIHGVGNDSGCDQGEIEIIVVVAYPAIAAGRLPEAILLPVVHVIPVLPVLIGQPIAARPAGALRSHTTAAHRRRAAGLILRRLILWDWRGLRLHAIRLPARIGGRVAHHLVGNCGGCRRGLAHPHIRRIAVTAFLLARIGGCVARSLYWRDRCRCDRCRLVDLRAVLVAIPTSLGARIRLTLGTRMERPGVGNSFPIGSLVLLVFGSLGLAVGLFATAIPVVVPGL